MELTILGCGSAIPTTLRAPTAQIIRIDQENILIDCGEGTQTQIKKFGVKLQQISTILISHLHGDHYFGLPGLIGTMQLLGRVAPLTIYGPAPLEKIIRLGLDVSYTRLKFDLNFVVTNPKKGEQLVTHKKYTIASFPLKHKIDTTGFVIRETPKLPNMKGDLVKFFNIPHYAINGIKAGDDFVTEDGEVIKHEVLTKPAPKPKSYAFCSDTKYYESVIKHIKGVDVLYHEATFLNALIKRAVATMHCTAEQAAIIAKQAEVGTLIIGHYSARYTAVDEFKIEASAVFNNTILAEDGLVHKI